MMYCEVLIQSLDKGIDEFSIAGLVLVISIGGFQPLGKSLSLLSCTMRGRLEMVPAWFHMPKYASSNLALATNSLEVLLVTRCSVTAKIAGSTPVWTAKCFYNSVGQSSCFVLRMS